ncbi:MAG: nitroreductase family protein [Oscillochloridaceae bacterium umkhey_bin13]
MSTLEPTPPTLSASEAIRTKRAVRRYAERVVPEAAVRAILEAGRRAQSSKNDQPWTFVLVSERAQLQRLSSAGIYTAHVPQAAFAIVLVAPPGYEFDLGQAAAYMQLVALEHGVGSCLISLQHRELACTILGVPDELRCDFAITFGYSNEPPRPLRAGGRRPLIELVRHERFD